jgi:hypothetical protein
LEHFSEIFQVNFNKLPNKCKQIVGSGKRKMKIKKFVEAAGKRKAHFEAKKLLHKKKVTKILLKKEHLIEFAD